MLCLEIFKCLLRRLHRLGPGSKSHTAGVLVSKCGDGEPPREERTAARGSAPLHLRLKQRPSL
jgi:hypothetical protein